MKEIKLLMEHIEDELEDAHTYAELAVEYKHDDPELADLFYRLSGEEMNHMNALHKAVVSHIEEYRKQKGEPPAAMMATCTSGILNGRRTSEWCRDCISGKRGKFRCQSVANLYTKNVTHAGKY